MHSTLMLNRQQVVPGDSSGSGVHTQLLSVDTNHSGPVNDGPPTPTHSETPDCAKGMVIFFFIVLSDYMYNKFEK